MTARARCGGQFTVACAAVAVACLSLACARQPAMDANPDSPASSQREFGQHPVVDSSTTMLAITYVGPPALQPLLTVTVQDRNGVRTVRGRELSRLREGGTAEYTPELTLRVPAPDTIRARVQFRRSEDDSTTVGTIELSGVVWRELAHRIVILPHYQRPIGYRPSMVHVIPFSHPAAPGTGDSLFVAWDGFSRCTKLIALPKDETWPPECG